MKGEDICKLRKKVYLSQSQMADKLNISQSYLSKIENGSRQASPDLIKKINELLISRLKFNFSVEQIFVDGEIKEQIIMSLANN